MATGAKSATYDYNAFGETIQSDGVAATANHFRFSTKYTDDETGLLYYGFRFYQPTTGRWLSRDPIEEQGGVNLYGMGANNPINRIDPLGLSLYTDLTGSFDPYKPTQGKYGSLYSSYHSISIKLCCPEQANKLADQIYARMKEFKEFNAGNNSTVTVSDGYALFFPNSAAELLGSIATGHPYVTVSLMNK